MSEKFKKCFDRVKSRGTDSDNVYSICNEAMGANFTDKIFTDSITYDSKTKRVVSVRDGVMEYYGYEIGAEPEDKVFRVYRHPDTINDIFEKMIGLPITDEHVSTDMPPEKTDIVGSIESARKITVTGNGATIGIENKIKLDRETGNKQLSLAGFADLIPCEKYDFEQVNIIPHHLAIVERGRCGDACSFQDRIGANMKKKKEEKKEGNINQAFLDADGSVNIQQVMELVQDLPEAIKQVGISELSKMVPNLQKLVEVSKQRTGMTENNPDEEVPAEEDMAIEDEGMVDAEPEDMPAEEEEKKKENFSDSKAFKDAVKKAAEKQTREYSVVIAKAKDFLDSGYAFGEKDSKQIMRDALATQYTEKFEDSELATAFKLLKRIEDYKSFGDAHPDDKWKEIEEKEI